MACSKYIITNTGSTIVNFNYRRCDDAMWEYQVELSPNQTKNIWLVNDTYSIAPLFSSSIVLVNDGAYPPPIIVPVVTTGEVIPNPNQQQVITTGNTISDLSGGIDCGICWSESLNPTILDSHVSVALGSPFNATGTGLNSNTDFYLRAYYTNLNGTYYGNNVAFNSGICFPEGTLITMSNGQYKKIEDIDYSDSLLVWNFDESHFDVASPIWIMKPVEYKTHVMIGFSDGTELGIAGNLQSTGSHRIFNIEKGEFTYAIPDEHTPIGTHTFNDKGEIVTIISKSLVEIPTNIYNVVTDFHMNIFAGGILTSRRLNNIYPIVNMKFVKDGRTINPHEMFPDVSYEYYEGLRLGEQPLSNKKEGITTTPTSEELNKWVLNFESSKLIMELV